jgi:hypothetical protein
MRGVDDLGPAKAAIDHIVPRKIGREGFPKPNRRGPGKHDCAFGRRIGGIALLISRNLFFPSGKIVGLGRLLWGGSTTGNEDCNDREQNRAGHSRTVRKLHGSCVARGLPNAKLGIPQSVLRGAGFVVRVLLPLLEGGITFGRETQREADTLYGRGQDKG